MPRWAPGTVALWEYRMLRQPCLSVLLGMVLALVLAGPAARGEGLPPGVPVASLSPRALIPPCNPADADGDFEPPVSAKRGNLADPEEEYEAPLLEKFQAGVYLSVCTAARRVDAFFGSVAYDDGVGDSSGRLGLFQDWDDRDGFDTRLRLRVRVSLPAMENRLRLLLGRGDPRELVEGRDPQTGVSLPRGFSDVEDDAWLLGLGYSPGAQPGNGFDFGAGVRLKSPVDPYTKVAYGHIQPLTDLSVLRLRQTVFWRDSRGWGETTDVEYDYLLTPDHLLRWDNTATLAQDVSRLEWGTALLLYQRLGPRRGLSYTAYLNGIAGDEVPLRDYGVEVRFRRPVLREWLFLELRSSLGWPKELPEEERKINPGVGIGFEMYFGPVPGNELR